MSINAEVEGIDHTQSPRLMRAGHSARFLWRLSCVFAAIILVFLIASLIGGLWADCRGMTKAAVDAAALIDRR